MRRDGPGTRFPIGKMSTLKLKLQIELLEPLEHNSEALQVLFLCAAKDDDIVQVDHAVCEVQLCQGVLHEMLECHRLITQPKQHAGKLVESEVTHHEGCVLPVSYTHLRAHETLRYLVCRLLLEKKK